LVALFRSDHRIAGELSITDHAWVVSSGLRKPSAMAASYALSPSSFGPSDSGSLALLAAVRRASSGGD